MTRDAVFVRALVLALCAALSACVGGRGQAPARNTVGSIPVLGTAGSAMPPSAAASGPVAQAGYTFSPGDEFDLRVPDAPQFDQTLKVRADGKFSLALIGTVQALGRTPEEVEAELLGRYERVLRNPALAVVLRTPTTQNVRVAGGMARAGLANLQPTVIVRTAQLPQIFVGGEVLRPGVLAWRPGLTVIQAVAESGWYLPTAEISKLMVLRRTADNRSEVLRPEFGYDLNRELKSDVVLQPFDIVLLPKTSAANLADALNQYVFNILPPLRNSSLGFSYVLRDSNPP